MNRRIWLQQSALTLTGLSIAGSKPALARRVAHKVTPHLATAIRLNANENPYGPSALAQEAMQKALARSNRYPGDLEEELISRIAEQEGLTPDHVLLGPGSSELLELAGTWFGKPGVEILTADITFSLLQTYARRAGAQVVEVPLDTNFRYDLAAIQRKLKEATGLVYIVNPNNPTSTALPAEVLLSFCQKTAAHTPVMVDEAYLEFVAEPNYPSMVQCIPQGHDVLVVKTFSKIYGLAGLRVGYLLAQPERIAALKALQFGWFNQSNVALAAAMATYQEEGFISLSRRKNEEAREITRAALRSMDIIPAQSETNFIFFEIPKERFSPDLTPLMAEHNLIIRSAPNPQGFWYRVSMGRPDEMEMFAKTFTSLL
ncbi:MAG: histidinol-phosphate transaminase [Bacteroidota bacterium]